MTEAQMRDLLAKMEALVSDADDARKEIRAGITDLGVRIARLETKFDGGIITVDLCNEREKAVHSRIEALKERLDGHVTWMRLIGVGIVLSMAGVILAAALR